MFLYDMKENKMKTQLSALFVQIKPKPFIIFQFKTKIEFTFVFGKKLEDIQNEKELNDNYFTLEMLFILIQYFFVGINTEYNGLQLNLFEKIIQI